MSKRRGTGKPKRGGPGRPTRPMHAGSSRIGGTGDQRPNPPPTAALVDAILDDFEPDPSIDATEQAVVAELSAVAIWRTFTETPGPHLRPMIKSLAQGLASRRTPAADRALGALAAVGTSFGFDGTARAWAGRRREPDVDPVAAAIGMDELVSAFEVGHVMGDGVNVMLEVANPLGRYGVGVYVDHNLAGIAKDLLVGPSRADIVEAFRAEDGFRIRDIPRGEAAWRFRDATAQTGQMFDPPVGDDFDDLFPVVERRFGLVPAEEPRSATDPDGNPIRWVEVSTAERIAHAGAFATSPEFEAIDPGVADDAFEAARTWIDFAVDATIGGPRRVSPVMVEIFCVDWFPRKVLADAAFAAAVPTGVEAWLRFCARTTALDERWLDEALRALATHSPFLSGGASPGPGLDVVGRFASSAGGAGELASFFQPADIQWRRLEQGVPGETVHSEVDACDVLPWQAGKARIVAQEAALQASALLGPSFAQPAMEIAAAIGSVDPSPYDHSSIGSWPGAIVWILAEDNDAFDRKVVGRRRSDLADALPMTRATYEAKAKKVRTALGVTKGHFRVP